MRKRIVGLDSRESATRGDALFDLERVGRAELTSEDPAYPIEAALSATAQGGWRAADAGTQLVRLLFDEPLSLRRIQLLFRETEQERTQEFVLRWSADGGRTYREVVRQQYHFSPPTTTQEVEDYRVELDGVTVLELAMVPDIGGGPARASLERLRLG